LQSERINSKYYVKNFKYEAVPTDAGLMWDMVALREIKNDRHKT
jgi:hypothetical protein